MVDEKPTEITNSAPPDHLKATQIADIFRDSIHSPAPSSADNTLIAQLGGTSADQTGQANDAAPKSLLATALSTPQDTPAPNFMDTEIQNSATLRRGVAFGEGLGYALPGAIKAAYEDVTHPMQLVEKAGTAATIGLAMRVLLPAGGAGKAVVGAVMGYYMVKDAVQPMIKGWEESGKAQNMDQVNTAAQHIGDGVGAFAWDAYVGSKVGLKAEKLTGRAMDATLGTANYSAFERWKVDVDNKFISKPLEKVLSPLSRAADWAGEKMVRKEEQPEIKFQDVKHKFAEVEAQMAVNMRNVDLHLLGAMGKDGARLGFSETLDLLEMGHHPSEVESTKVHQILGQDVLEQPVNRVVPGDGTAQSVAPNVRPVAGYDRLIKGIVGASDNGQNDDSLPPARTISDAAKPPVVPGDSSPLAKPGTDHTGTGTTSPSGKPYVTKAEKEINVDILGKLAVMNRTLTDAWSDKKVLIEDAKERLAGPVHAAVTPEYTKMDPGYILARNQMMNIASQLKTEDDLKYVMPLMSRFSMAAVQHISDGLSSTAALKYQLDLMALETHSELVRNMKKVGIDADVVLRSKTPPVFSVSHDGGAGPHTMRQIDGVWNVDHVLFPRNMIDTRSTTTSGIYSHEIIHDQYGGMLKFDESIREQVIANAIAKGLGSRANETINFPGVGPVTKQNLYEAIFKAQADENTADIGGAAWTGQNCGGALGLLLQSLRKGGKLETRNVYGTEYKSAENPFGFEVHAFDALRPKIVAAVMRARANGDKNVIESADALSRYADDASRPGDYVFANMDKPGETVTIPRKDLEDIVPHLVDAQLNTKLSALQGHSFSEVLPDLPSNLAKMDTLADLIVDAIRQNKKPSQIPFDVSQYSIIQVFGAGLPAASRLVAGGMDATEANTAVNTMSDHLRGLYHANDPHIDPLKPSALQTIRLTSPKSLWAGSALASRDFVHNTGEAISRAPQLGDWLASRATAFAATDGVAGIDKNYRKAITAQSVGQLDLAPLAMTNTIAGMTAMDKAKQKLLQGQQDPEQKPE